MKQWKTFGLLVLLVCAGVVLKAQDIVRLKNGSFIRGTIIEYIADDHVRIKTVDGKVYEYPAADVLSTDVGEANVGRSRKPLVIKTKGYYNITTLGLNLGNNYGSLTRSPGLYTVNGWQWNAHLMTGIGVGLEHLQGAVRAPLTADVRWKFLPGSFSPYVGLNGGYTLSGRAQSYYYFDGWGQSTENKGGITTGAQVGFISQVGPHLGLTASVGYRYQKFTREYTQGFWNGTTTVPIWVTERSYLHRVTLGFGLMFN
jgi:hypothetical protein